MMTRYPTDKYSLEPAIHYPKFMTGTNKTDLT